MIGLKKTNLNSGMVKIIIQRELSLLNIFSTTGTIVNQLLDAILCVSDGATNCYNNTTAKAVGIGMVGTTLINWNGTRWHQASNTSQILINDQNSLITELWTTDQSWATIGAIYVAGKSLNGLYYDNCTLNNSQSLEYTTDKCLARGMRLPLSSESAGTSFSGSATGPAGTTNGVPSCPGVYSWTASLSDSCGYHRWMGNILYAGCSTRSTLQTLRCVK